MAEAKARKLEEARQAVAEAKLRAEQKEAAAQVRTHSAAARTTAETRHLTATRNSNPHTCAQKKLAARRAAMEEERAHRRKVILERKQCNGGSLSRPSLVLTALTHNCCCPVCAPQLHLPEEKPPVTLDDLFRKTKTEPAVYWLPVSAQRVERLRARGGITRPPQVRYVYD